jgi:hypothetical protein
MEVACFSIILAAQPTFTQCTTEGQDQQQDCIPMKTNEKLIRCVYKIAKRDY